jgi:dTDP-4-dehydrorhamnose 3,5-epimerase
MPRSANPGVSRILPRSPFSQRAPSTVNFSSKIASPCARRPNTATNAAPQAASASAPASGVSGMRRKRLIAGGGRVCTLARSMRRLETRLDGPILIEPRVFGDERGFFQETYRRNVYAELGIPEEMVQDNHSRSGARIVRGMHFQVGAGAAKLVRCARGAILDVMVDLRKGSPTFGQWEGFKLTDENHHIAYCPVGFAHGFCVLSDVADVMYKQSSYYDDDNERGISYRDPDVGIEWPFPLDELIVSERDAAAPTLAEVQDELPFRYESASP